VDYYFRFVKFEIERSVSAMAKEFREPTGVIIPEVFADERRSHSAFQICMMSLTSRGNKRWRLKALVKS